MSDLCVTYTDLPKTEPEAWPFANGDEYISVHSTMRDICMHMAPRRYYVCRIAGACTIRVTTFIVIYLRHGFWAMDFINDDGGTRGQFEHTVANTENKAHLFITWDGKYIID